MLSAANNKIDTLFYTPSSKTWVFLSPNYGEIMHPQIEGISGIETA